MEGLFPFFYLLSSSQIRPIPAAGSSVYFTLYLWWRKDPFPQLALGEMWRKGPIRCTLMRGIVMLEAPHALLHLLRWGSPAFAFLFLPGLWPGPPLPHCCPSRVLPFPSSNDTTHKLHIWAPTSIHQDHGCDQTPYRSHHAPGSWM